MCTNKCHCVCHENTEGGTPKAIHIMACCYTCPDCKMTRIKNLDTHVEQHGSVTVYDLKLLLAVQPLLHDRYFGWKSIDDFGVYRNARNGRWFIRVAPPVSLT